ncbi:type II toxin-antitoxin system RelE/ParE family toxin [Roseivirga pacifica]|uniref:type II toxin-antitoxin system RelE/ParE family toxin n=1 Tax=Roseivirga pacifica TaxID=1267423 RepID=UPI003B8A83BC
MLLWKRLARSMVSRIIEWSPRARNEFDKTVAYLINKWGKSSAIKFINRVEEVLAHISKSPNIYPQSGQRKHVRRCVVAKQVSLYFKVDELKIELVTFFDTRLNPSKKKL